MKYAEALKHYFGKKGEKVHFPKKGSSEHAEIRKLMASGDIASGSGVSAQVALATGEVKKKRPGRSKAAPGPKASEVAKDAPPPTASKSTIIDPTNSQLNKGQVNSIVDAPEKAPVRRKAGKKVQANGETPQSNLLDALANKNDSTLIAQAAYPGLREQIEAILAVKPEGIPKEKKTRPRKDVTVESLTTNDPKAIAGERVPFSFAAFRQKIRA